MISRTGNTKMVAFQPISILVPFSSLSSLSSASASSSSFLHHSRDFFLFKHSYPRRIRRSWTMCDAASTSTSTSTSASASASSLTSTSTSNYPARDHDINTANEEIERMSRGFQSFSSDPDESVYCYVACSPLKNDYLEQILTSRVYDVAIESPLDYVPLLSKKTNNYVYLKREDLQPVFSFKLRGAYNMMSKLPFVKVQQTPALHPSDPVVKEQIAKSKNHSQQPPQQPSTSPSSSLLHSQQPPSKSKGVVAASAGNHAQGVALGAKVLGIRAVIVMPQSTPEIKVNAVRALGGEVILHGDNFDAAKEYAMQMAGEDLAWIPPFDHPDVIAGQGTIGLEILKQFRKDKLEAIFIPVGGGGLIAGIAVVVKRLKPAVKIIGVEPYDANALYLSMQQGKRVRLTTVGKFADGVAVTEVGEETFRICKDLVDEVVLVTTDQICAAMKDVFEDTRTILEPSGALSVAGLKKYAEENKLTKKNLIAIASGANTNFDRLRHVSERAEIGENREAIYAVSIPEKPGEFKKLVEVLGDVSVTEFNYRFANPKKAQIYVGISVVNREDAKDKLAKILEAGYSAIDLTDNELAKLHLRHMTGGAATLLKNELVYRFEFPERQGALKSFLSQMKFGWSISLFHYRNHGTDVGRVLVGVRVPQNDRVEFRNLVENLGYFYVDESENEALKIFLNNRH